MSSVGAEHGHLLVGKQHVGTPCGILAPSRTTRSENNLLGGKIPLFLSDVKEPEKLKNPVAGFSFYGNLIPALTGDEISPLPAPPSTGDVPEGRAASVFVPHLTFLVTDALR